MNRLHAEGLELEDWKIGLTQLEDRKVGRFEGFEDCSRSSNIRFFHPSTFHPFHLPSFQSSILPIFQSSILPISLPGTCNANTAI